MRQHVNPLSRFFQLPLRLPVPEDLFEQPELPIHLDIGSARGNFLLQLASFHSDWNYLGVEIRLPLVKSSDIERQEKGLNNLRFLFCNANVSLDDWLVNLSIDQLQRVSIQFPDPWFKNRHKKRRVLQPSLLLAISIALQPGRELFIQSDILEVIQNMIELIEMSGCFVLSDGSTSEWPDKSPFSVYTEREQYALEQGLPVYRAIS